MSQRGRIALIFAGVAIVLGAGGFYFFGVYQPGRAREIAQGQIEEWEGRLAKARACLIGDKPASAKTSEAMAIRELAPDTWDRAPCTKLVGNLTRGDAEDTGLAEVESAWERVDAAANQVAKSFVARVDTGMRGMDPEKLPAALDALDKAHDELRDAAGMERRAAASAPVLPAAEIVPILEGKSPVTSIDSVLASSMGTVVALGGAPSVELLLTAGAPPRTARVQPDVRRSVADSAWGMVVREDGVEVGAIDAAGNLTGATKLVAHKPKAKQPPPGSDDDLYGGLDGLTTEPLFAVGGASDGVAVAIVADQLLIARVDGGKLVVEPPRPVEDYAIAAAPNGRGRGAIAWSDLDGVLHAAVIQPGLPTKVVDLGTADPYRVCVTATHAWVSTKTDELLGITDAGVVSPHLWRDHDLVGCTDKAVLMRNNGRKNRYVACAGECREADIRSTNANAFPALAGDEVISVSSRGKVLAVFRQRGEPLFFALPEPVALHFVHATPKTADVLARSDNSGAMLIRVPL